MDTPSLKSVKLSSIVNTKLSFETDGWQWKSKGSLVLANIYSVNMDETYWTDPHEFRPERHLDAEGLRFIKSEHVMPFGSGDDIFSYCSRSTNSKINKPSC